jgi:serine/threonine protein phosphatase PrpC
MTHVSTGRLVAAHLPTLDVGSYSSAGVREQNEDRVETRQTPQRLIALIADGMGGGEIGAAMSDQVIKIAAESLQSSGKDTLENELRQAFQAANQAIQNFRQLHERYAKSGSTLTSAVIQVNSQGTIAHLAHVGDSRAYLVNGSSIKQISRDHNLYEDLRARGVAAEQARKDPNARKLTYCLGSSLDVVSAPQFYTQHRLQPGDTLILCTDGVSEFVAPVAIGEIVGGTRSASRIAQKLVTLALKQGSTDNASCVVVRYAPPRSFPFGRLLLGLLLALGLAFGAWAAATNSWSGADDANQPASGGKTSATITALPTTLAGQPTSTLAPGQPTSTRAPTPTNTPTPTPTNTPTPTPIPPTRVPATPVPPTRVPPATQVQPTRVTPPPDQATSTALPEPPTELPVPPTELPPTPVPPIELPTATPGS